MKRFLSIFLALLMLFSVNVTVYAANDTRAELSLAEPTSEIDQATLSELNKMRDEYENQTVTLPPEIDQDRTDYVEDDTVTLPPEIDQGRTDYVEDDTVTLPPEIDQGRTNFVEEDSQLNWQEEVCYHTNSYKIYTDTEYEKYNSSKHFYYEWYEIRCSYCDEVLEEAYESSKETHEFSLGKCKSCGYKAKECEHLEFSEEIVYWNNSGIYTVEIICDDCDVKLGEKTYYSDEESDLEEKEELNSNEDSKQVPSNSESTENTTSTQTTSPIIQDTNSNKVTTTITQEKDKGNSDFTGITNSTEKSSKKVYEQIEFDELWINPDFSYFQADCETFQWNSCPIIDSKGNLLVPLRELSQILGWQVSWDNEKNHATVSDGSTTKLFMQDLDVYEITVDGDSKFKKLQADVKNYNGILYVDLDGVLDGTTYSYYRIGSSYYIEEREKVIEKVTQNVYNGNENLVGSITLIDDVVQRITLKEDETFVYLTQKENSYYYTVIVPAANQALEGNYYNGQLTWEGLAAEIIVGELPIVGTGADFRDIVADFDNWEWSWAHVGQTALDGVGIVPVFGVLKYSDEVATLAKKSGQVLNEDALKATQKLLNQSDSVDDIMDAAQSALKYSDEYIAASKAAIKSVDDLKALAKDPDIYADGVLEHIFYGNSRGGLHYNGLSGANGEIVKIEKVADNYGVYEATISINGKLKRSTFFPDEWTPEQVLDVIDEAYQKGSTNLKNQKIYTFESGMTIELNLDSTGKIRSAYPSRD